MRVAHYMIGMSERGGIAMHTRIVSDAQRHAGHEVFFFDLERSRKPNEDWPGIHYFRDEAALLAEAQRLNINLLHAHILLERAPESKVPVLRTLHGHEPYCPSGGHYLGRQRERCTRRYHPVSCTWGHVADRCGSMRPVNLLANLRRAKAEMRSTMQLNVLTVSEYLREQMIRNGYEPRRIATLHPPAPSVTPWTPLADGLPRFLFIGRVTPSKGVDWFLKAAALAKMPFAIDIAGDGNAMGAVKELAASIARPIAFHGWVNREQTNLLLRNCRALVVPSLWPEPAGLVALEAMAHGRPAIVAAHGGLPELVGAVGQLVLAGDVHALAAVLDQLANDLDMATRMGHAGQQRVAEQFTLEMHLQKLLEHYHRAIEEWPR